MASWSTSGWAAGTGLGDESHTHSATQSGKTYIYVLWRSGVVTNEVVLVALKGSRTLQDAIDIAKIQQTRTVAAHA